MEAFEKRSDGKSTLHMDHPMQVDAKNPNLY